MQICSVIWQKIYPFLPLIMYSILALLTISRQSQVIPDKRYTILDGRMNANLTLVGFAFAVIGLLVSLFQKTLPVVFDAIYLFSVALVSFFGSYVLLYLRLRRFFDTMSEALTNNGLWAVMVGLWLLFKSFPELSSISSLFFVLLIGIVIYVATDIKFKWQDRNTNN